MKLIEIFKPGKQIAASGDVIVFSEDDLKACAAAYDPALSEAPLVVGHPKTDAPAYGWVQSLSYSDGLLSATPDQVEPAFAELVNAGRFKKRSASFYKPDSPHNPKPGVYYLRHVGFLGAQPPAVKGLKDASFAGGDEGVIEFSDWGQMQNASLWRRVREFLIEKFSVEDADRIVPDYVIQSLEDSARAPDAPSVPSYNEPTQEIAPMKNLLKLLGLAETATEADAIAAVNTRAASLDAKEASFAEREQRIVAGEKKLIRVGHENFLDGLIKEGKLLPAQKGEKLEFMCALSDEATLEFGEGEQKTKKSPLAAYKEQLVAAPKLVDFTERAGGSVAEASTDPTAIATRAHEFMESEQKAGRTINIAQAVAHVQQQAAN